MSAAKHIYFLSESPKETFDLGAKIGKNLSAGDVLALNGGLGSGKTVFVQGLAKGLGIKNRGKISSPTFALIQEHRGKIPLCHVDLYRLAKNEIPGIGLEEYWQEEAPAWVVAVEWADKVSGFLPEKNTYRVEFETVAEKKRKIIFYEAKKWKKILKNIEKKFQDPAG